MKSDHHHRALGLPGLGKPRGFAFVRFATIEEAEDFLDANHPSIYIYGDNPNGSTSQNAKVRITYGRDRTSNERVQETDWTCRVVRNVPSVSSAIRTDRAVQHKQLFYQGEVF